MKKILLLFLFLIITVKAEAKLLITHYQEEVKISDIGQEVTVKIKANVQLPARNLFYNNWAYSFDKSLSVEIIEAKVINKQFKTEFSKITNELKFTFDKILNGDSIEFLFKYSIKNDYAFEKYTRQEFVSLPAFANGARGKLTVEIPDNLEVYSLNKNFSQNGRKYEWINKIPKNGFSDIFSLTPKEARWNIEILNEIIGKETPSRISVQIPPYFIGGPGVIEKLRILTNYNEDVVKIEKNDDNIGVDFIKTDGKLTQIKLNSIIKNDLSNKVWLKFNPSDKEYTYIDQKTKNNLSKVIYQIQSISAREESPMYIEIAKWVHNYIKYDERYVEKNKMTAEDILKEGKGVCFHYSVLYDALLKSYGIPSIIVSGISYNQEIDDFEMHSWNLVFANGEWLSMDPTWGIYSGKLPISHIFFYLNSRNYITFSVYDAFISDFDSSIKFYVEKID